MPLFFFLFFACVVLGKRAHNRVLAAHQPVQKLLTKQNQQQKQINKTNQQQNLTTKPYNKTNQINKCVFVFVCAAHLVILCPDSDGQFGDSEMEAVRHSHRAARQKRRLGLANNLSPFVFETKQQIKNNQNTTFISYAREHLCFCFLFFCFFVFLFLQIIVAGYVSRTTLVNLRIFF
jgi:hypothetical protein